MKKIQMLFSNKLFLPVFLSVIFFIIGFATITGYGINWDTINHLPRGQSYLHYFLTGRKDYSDLPAFKSYFQDPKKLMPSTSQTRSYYQTNAADFTWFMEFDGAGHPPLSDIFSSIFNRVLFGNLHIVNDIDSYHVYGIFLGAILVGLICYWVSDLYGKTAGVLAALFTGLYPLFFSEMHFNTEKDIPETVFWSLFLYSFWKGVTASKSKWILLSGVFFGFALGTKFNILFIPVVIAPWLLVYISKKFKDIKIKGLVKLGVVSIIAIVTGMVIFVGSWPYLWADPIMRITEVFGFYKGIGLTTNVDSRFIGPLSTNTYPIKWIIFTTQPILLFIFAFGVLYSIYLIYKKKDYIQILFLSWLVVPIARVSYPGTTIYGGIRQIMEYIPAMAIIAGIGASYLISKIKNKLLKCLALVIIIAGMVIPVWKIHPNENTYFNFLVGGMQGAVNRNLPSWGNSFGAGYRKGIEWINDNAESNATVVLAYELSPNIPLIWLRSDLTLDNRNRSGFLKAGEYAITLTYQGIKDRSYYDLYLETILDPVYETKVDGVGIVKVWKNDIEHTKVQYSKEIESRNIKLTKDESGILVDLGQIQYLSRIEANFRRNSVCKDLKYAYSEVSVDNKNWKRLPGVMPKEDWNTSAYGEEPKKDSFRQPFAGNQARYVKYNIAPADACLKNITSIKVFNLVSK